MKSPTPLVAIHCITYNHAAYIRQCLDGFVMQRTDFAFVAIVHDDCSTDGTDNIVREYAQRYPHIIKPIFETENQYSKGDGSLSRIMTQACNNTGAKYIAMCEGDDYWTDPLKLQKQVDFLEKHPECSLCYHACENKFEGENIYLRVPFGENVNESYSYEELPSYPFHTATIMYRLEIANSDLYIKACSIGCPFGDVVLFLCCSQFGRLCGINEKMSVYRRLDSGVSNQIHNTNFAIKKTWYWIKLLECFNSVVQRKLHQQIIEPTAIYLFFHSHKKEFFRIFRYEVFHLPNLAIIIAYKILKITIYNLLHEE